MRRAAVYPDWELKDPGLTLRFNAEASVLGVGVSAQHDWKFGAADCSAAAAAQLTAQSANLDGIPADGQPALALAPGGRAAVIWSGLSDAATARPSGDIFLKFYDPASAQWTAPIQLTSDLQADQAPSAVFLDDSKLLVAWQRNSSPTLGDASTLSQFAAGFEIQSAIVAVPTGEILHSETLTSNSVVDFGPRLSAAADGSVLLAWQRATGLDFLGTAANPASVQSRLFVNGQWTDEKVVATGLKATFGWNTAILDQNHAAIALVIDGDADFGTTEDTELFLANFESGVWSSPKQITANAISDWAPQLAYTADHQLAVAWLSGGALVGTIGSSDSQTSLAADSSPGTGFSHGQLLSHPRGLIAIWPRANDFYYSTSWVDDPADKLPGSTWAKPKPLTSTTPVEILGAAEVSADGKLHFASLQAPVVTDTLAHLGASLPALQDVALSTAALELRILQIQPAIDGSVTLSWQSVAGKTYAIESSGVWTPQSPITATGAEASKTITLPGQNAAFFRIVLQP
jgi:hypothetical protein